MQTNTIETITPEIARRMLSKLYHGQKGRLSKGSVAGMVRTMKAGHWRLSPEGIAISDRGELMDGQNRLTALIEAGVTLQMWVARGIPEEVFSVMNSGRPRSLAFRTGRTPIRAAMLSQVCEVARYGASSIRITEDMVSVADDLCHAALDMFELSGVKTNRPGITVTGLKVGVVLNLHHHPEDVANILSAFNAMASGDFASAPESVNAIVSRLTGQNKQRLRVDRLLMLAMSWRCFDPYHFNDSRIVIRDLPSIIREIRDGVLADLRSAIADSTPAQAGGSSASTYSLMHSNVRQ